jgi:exopolyphosphatase / guanosine-5'-triphosphate,3'-diphosphate pyrophosphatase
MTVQNYLKNTDLYGKRIAAIDIGSHTTRMLVAEYTDSPEFFLPIAREMVYTHLAEGFCGTDEGDLVKDAVIRTADTIKAFVDRAKKCGAGIFLAISTGIARSARNKKYLLDSVKGQAGIDIRIISGEEEAHLTRRGVIHGSGRVHPDSSVIFDLGGATTEFIWGKEEDQKIASLPIGALVLTQEFLLSDPPEEDMLRALGTRIDSILEQGLSREKDGLNNIRLTGAGGTATNLAAIINGLGVREITPERINGLILSRDQIERLFSRIKPMPVSGRKKIRGMEQGRAGVIIAGALAVTRIMHFVNAEELAVSYSDILEGILISYFLGEDNE